MDSDADDWRPFAVARELYMAWQETHSFEVDTWNL